MSSIILNEYSTEFTTVSDYIESRVDNSGNKSLFRVSNSTKQLTNVEQMNHIIHYLVVINGFLMEKHSSEKIIFVHPKNSFDMFASYTYYPKTKVMEKYEYKFIAYV